MKSFKQYITESSRKTPIGKDLRLSHLGELSEKEKAHVDQRMDLYVDRHNMSGVAAENKIAHEIKQMRESR
jgi:hypothetical protein